MAFTPAIRMEGQILEISAIKSSIIEYLNGQLKIPVGGLDKELAFLYSPPLKSFPPFHYYSPEFCHSDFPYTFTSIVGHAGLILIVRKKHCCILQMKWPGGCTVSVGEAQHSHPPVGKKWIQYFPHIPRKMPVAAVHS